MAVVSRYTPKMIDSYVRDGYWTPDRTVDFWHRNAQSRPDAVALADDREHYTWSQGISSIDAIAAGLIAAGVPRDGVLLVQAPNSALLVLFRLACEQAGVIPAFLHFGFRRSEIEAVANKVKPVGAVIAAGGRFDFLLVYEELRHRLALAHLFTVGPNAKGIASLAELAAASVRPTDFAERRMQPYEMTGIVTSSGTTGMPKCIEYSCWPRLASGRVYIERLKITSDDVILSCIPFYTGGGDMQFHTAPQVGAKFIVVPRFSPEEVCALIARENVTGAVLVPTMIARIAGLPNAREYALSSLRWVVSGGGMLPYDVGARFEDLTGATITQGYGLMDYGALASHGIDDPREKRLRSNGRLMTGTEFKVLDPAGCPLPPGSVGEMCARGPHCNGGYIDDPEGVQSAWRDGFFHTGDLGRVTEDGYIVLAGRSKDIIIRGGQNISAHEVEGILCRHPAVADAALVRMADPEMGERACAFVVLQPGTSLDFADMVAFMRSQEVAPYKIPERLEIATDFPMTAAGNKVDKKALEARLRQHAADRLQRSTRSSSMLTPKLFEPITIGGLRVKNRLNMPPMHTNLGSREVGISDSGIDFYVARAKGGFGLIGVGIIDAYFVDGAGSPLEFFLENDRHVANYARCVKDIARYGAVPYAQVGVRRLFPVKTMHREDHPTLSRMPSEQVEAMIQAVVDCAVRAAEAGFPAVDILGVGGSAHSIFLSQVFNDRTDEWGGTPEKRLRFALETIRGIKKALGEDFPVFYRLHGSEFLKGGYGIEQAVKNAATLAAAGVCYFNVTGGGHATSVPQLTPNVPQSAYSFLAAEIKRAVKVPVAASNRNNDPLDAEALLRKGWADMISLGRPALADAEWPNKVARSDFSDLRSCIACNECLDITVIHDQPVHCLVNPRQGVVSEIEDLPKAARPKKVVVIGGGVTGLQAALTCAERGHQTILLEKKNYLGGMWHPASYPSGREDLFRFLQWLVHSVKRAGVDIRLGTEATEQLLKKEKPDAIIVSVGSEPVVPDIPGIDRHNVLPAIRALEGGVDIGEKVAIIGGGGIGAEIAPYLARRWTLRPEVMEFLEEYRAIDKASPYFGRRGHDVTLITRQKRPGGSIGGSTRWVIAKELEHAGVRTLCGAVAKRITEKGVVVSRSGQDELIEADTVLFAAGLKPNLELHDRLKEKNLAPEIYSVGSPELATHAVHTVKEAFKVALRI